MQDANDGNVGILPQTHMLYVSLLRLPRRGACHYAINRQDVAPPTLTAVTHVMAARVIWAHDASHLCPKSHARTSRARGYCRPSGN